MYGKYKKINFQICRNRLEIIISRISFTTPADRRAALVDEAKALYTQYLDTPAEPAPLLDFVGERLSIEPEESDVVHDLLAHLAERMIILVKNRKKLKDRYDPKSPTNYRHLQEWYEDSVDKLQPRMGRIEATDRLIDQIVYRWWAD